MFRKPRELPNAGESPPKPSTGRPPTPPSATNSRIPLVIEENTRIAQDLTVLLSAQNKMMSKSNGRTISFAVGKARAKPNGSILSFFKKTASSSTAEPTFKTSEESLFLDNENLEEQEVVQIPTPPRDFSTTDISPKDGNGRETESDSFRFNEENGPMKRRRMDEVMVSSPLSPSRELAGRLRIGPFIEDSDNEEETLHTFPEEIFEEDSKVNHSSSESPKEIFFSEDTIKPFGTLDSPRVPRLKRESTNTIEEHDFQGLDDFIDDEFPEEGEEYLERKWMEEQTQFELSLEEDTPCETPLEKSESIINTESIESLSNSAATVCPICSMELMGRTDQEASVHVNDCLDGKSSFVLPSEQSSRPTDNKIISEDTKIVPSHKRFQRAAIAKPGQESPFSLASSIPQGSTAFSKLMSSHAEDTAWAAAAASETASRGKPAYQRTCPFYKILPGFFICVDAFRYGAVEGCKAYFLSHFHSDHYIGLTSSWCHGPIYCSHVTANLVRRQLRVDPKWVFDLDFDIKLEVPETQGVEVTMIPANHCPGSSLYLFEKVIGKGKTPKIQRVLHCGDFRACPAHVQHPRLRPDVVDIVTGRNIAKQKLDVCYLDTTYLTPKYAFPTQEDVIKACADMCVSLSKDKIDENDDWEKTKKERAGSGMVKFVRKGSGVIKQEADDDAEDEMILKSKRPERVRGRLLVIVGTYSIGKERICLGVARALNSKIYAPPNKQKICAALEDAELTARLTTDPLEAQVHMQMLMEIRAETLADYLTTYKPHFSRIVGFRPSGWNYRPPNSRFVESPAVQTVLHSENWKSRYTMAELAPQRGSTREAQCFGVPYSEHSSFRELTMFCCALRIDKIIPTVNVGSAKSREKMKGWCEKWAMDKKKNGLFQVADGQDTW